MNSIEARLAEAQRKYAPHLTQFLNDQDAEAFAPAFMEFRAEVERAAEDGVEHWTLWQMVAQWITDPEDRIACYTRTLAAMDNAPQANPANQRDVAVQSFFRADILVKIAEAHVQQGRRQ